MNEEYLKGLHEHLGIKDDYDTWIEAITNNEEYLQGLHKHLDVKDDYETWTNAVFGEVKKKRRIRFYFSRGRYGIYYTGRSGRSYLFGCFRDNNS